MTLSYVRAVGLAYCRRRHLLLELIPVVVIEKGVAA